MTRDPVQSSTIAAIGFDPVGATLEVQFQPDKYGNAPVWQYDDVMPDEYETLRASESIGRAFATLIKPHHASRKIAIVRLDGTTLEVLA